MTYENTNTNKPLVVGSNPTAASFYIPRPHQSLSIVLTTFRTRDFTAWGFFVAV